MALQASEILRFPIAEAWQTSRFQVVSQASEMVRFPVAAA